MKVKWISAWKPFGSHFNLEILISCSFWFLYFICKWSTFSHSLQQHSSGHSHIYSVTHVSEQYLNLKVRNSFSAAFTFTHSTGFHSTAEAMHFAFDHLLRHQINNEFSWVQYEQQWLADGGGSWRSSHSHPNGSPSWQGRGRSHSFFCGSGANVEDEEQTLRKK